MRSLPGNLTAEVWRHLRARDQRPRPDVKARLRVTNNAAGGTRIDLMDEIGYWGITAQDFVDELLAIDATTIELHVNSPGGDVFDGVAIMNALIDHPATVDVVVDGIAASAASYICMAGDSVKMNRGAQMMIHDALGLCVGNAADMEQMKALLDRISDTIAGLYAERAGGTTEGWRDLMRAETWYSATEAVDAGLADEAAAKAAADPDEDEPPGDPDEPDPDEDEPDPDEPGGDDPDEDDDDEEAAAKARATALLASYKYPGRAQAPAPTNNQTAAAAVDVSQLQAALKGAFT